VQYNYQRNCKTIANFGYQPHVFAKFLPTVAFASLPQFALGMGTSLFNFICCVEAQTQTACSSTIIQRLKAETDNSTQMHWTESSTIYSQPTWQPEHLAESATSKIYTKHHNSLITVSITRNIPLSKVGAKMLKGA
jgi:hypothetical protein